MHPNVVRIHDVGRDGEQRFVAMELVDGPSLRQWLAHPRPWREVLAVMRQAAAGLAAAHDAGLLHLDVRPENILLANDGRVVVSGFGAGGRRAPRSPSDVANGDYTAPELAAGRELDARTDQYSLCLVLREARLSAALLRRVAPAGGFDPSVRAPAGPPARPRSPRSGGPQRP